MQERARHVVRYRLRDAAVVRDHVLQSVLFRELVHQRPAWLTCATYELDGHGRALLLEVDDLARLRGSAALSYYLDGLPGRCEEPYRGLLPDSAVPPASMLVGCWDPVHDQWCVPYRGRPEEVEPFA
ncbi:hypothetical protein GCM10023201_57260 [Actinomycetospora corticicola]|uniref:Uncharacterized protein n=1 Tax=Actinomycetospora corticicola TaxID=663602 RepID=A0A7Y9J462_9PSEU|nr:hypothetical protein [Actinomycetospora corticicola]NYD34359.1 hypothetical protein [Actinomycetospora corticicola]